MLAAVNHSGDSDSTGAMCGNLLGTISGSDVIPGEWAADLIEADLIEQVAADLAAETPDADRYPPW